MAWTLWRAGVRRGVGGVGVGGGGGVGEWEEKTMLIPRWCCHCWWWVILALSASLGDRNSEGNNKGRSQLRRGVRCYTCINVSDNRVCNRFAIDRVCPRDMPFCHTLHIMDSKGRSVIVHKKCADPHECSPDRVGCLEVDRQRLCIACCDRPYCNRHVPTNYTNAIYSATRTKHKGNPSSAPNSHLSLHFSTLSLLALVACHGHHLTLLTHS